MTDNNKAVSAEEFSALGLNPDIVRAVTEKGYTIPTPIQAQAIPVILMGRDLLGCAQTGTGKTAGFTLPMIEILGQGFAKARMPRALVLAPTRELAAQVADNFTAYSKYQKLSMALLTGGTSMNDQLKKLDAGVDVVIATPGRFLDIQQRGQILLNGIKILVIDEADRMLDMGFIPDVEEIVRLLPPLRQTLFFSATIAPEVKKLAAKFLSNPKEVSVAPTVMTAATVTQHLVMTSVKQKRDVLRALLRQEEVQNAFIFCNRKRDVALLLTSLKRHGFNVGALHGDMVQSKRTETLDSFKRGEISLLVCSDVAARGLDISGMSHVFNFDVPFNAEDYVHRIGRTGRAGMTGVAYTLATPDEAELIEAIEKLIRQPLPRLAVEGVEASAFDETPAARSPASRNRRGGSGGKTTRVKAPPKASPRSAPPRQPEQAAQPAAAPPSTQSGPRKQQQPPRDHSHRRDDKADSSARGFGDHVPGFMRRTAAG